MKISGIPSAILVPKSLWKLVDEDGKQISFELSLDLSGLLHNLVKRSLRNKARKTSLYSGMIRGRVIEKKEEAK